MLTKGDNNLYIIINNNDNVFKVLYFYIDYYFYYILIEKLVKGCFYNYSNPIPVLEINV